VIRFGIRIAARLVEFTAGGRMPGSAASTLLPAADHPGELEPAIGLKARNAFSVAIALAAGFRTLVMSRIRHATIVS
jgi:hypothetical protein